MNEQQQMVQTLLQELPDDYRQTVVLRYWHDLSYEEIADLMHTTVSAIKSRLFRARRMLGQTGVERGLIQPAELAAADMT
jgi:RNA polymerase sigma-70 factor (ECF subfamily)